MPKLRRPRSRAASEPVIALVDVVFFLLVFFMLVARLDATAPFDVLPPISRAGDDLPGGGVTVSIGSGGAIAIDAAVTPNGAWQDMLRDVMQTKDAHYVRLNADGAAPLSIVLPIVTALENGAFGDVVLVVTPPPQ